MKNYFYLPEIKIYCPIENRRRLVAGCDINDKECMCIEKLNLSYSKRTVKRAYEKTEKKYRHKNFPKTLKDFVAFINNNMRDQTFSMSTSYIWKDYRDFLSNAKP